MVFITSTGFPKLDVDSGGTGRLPFGTKMKAWLSFSQADETLSEKRSRTPVCDGLPVDGRLVKRPAG